MSEKLHDGIPISEQISEPTLRERLKKCIDCGALVSIEYPATRCHCDACQPAYEARIDAISERHRIAKLEDDNRRMRRELDRQQAAKTETKKRRGK